MDLTTILATGLISGVSAVGLTLAAFRILKSRLEAYFSSVASSFVSVMLGDVGSEPEKYAPIIENLLLTLMNDEKFIKNVKPIAINLGKQAVGEIMGSMGGDGKEVHFLPKQFRMFEPLVQMYMQNKASQAVTSTVAGAFG